MIETIVNAYGTQLVSIQIAVQHARGSRVAHDVLTTRMLPFARS